MTSTRGSVDHRNDSRRGAAPRGIEGQCRQNTGCGHKARFHRHPPRLSGDWRAGSRVPRSLKPLPDGEISMYVSLNRSITPRAHGFGSSPARQSSRSVPTSPSSLKNANARPVNRPVVSARSARSSSPQWCGLVLSARLPQTRYGTLLPFSRRHNAQRSSSASPAGTDSGVIGIGSSIAASPGRHPSKRGSTSRPSRQSTMPRAQRTQTRTRRARRQRMQI